MNLSYVFQQLRLPYQYYFIIEWTSPEDWPSLARCSKHFHQLFFPDAATELGQKILKYPGFRLVTAKFLAHVIIVRTQADAYLLRKFPRSNITLIQIRLLYQESLAGKFHRVEPKLSNDALLNLFQFLIRLKKDEMVLQIETIFKNSLAKDVLGDQYFLNNLKKFAQISSDADYNFLPSSSNTSTEPFTDATTEILTASTSILSKLTPTSEHDNNPARTPSPSQGGSFFTLFK